MQGLSGNGSVPEAEMPDVPVHVACGCDANYLPHVATMLTSVAASNQADNVIFHLLHDDSVTADLRDRLCELADRLGIALGFLQPSEQLLESVPPGRGYFPPIVWYRILLSELLPELDRVLYIDADALVMQDLRPLWFTDLGGALVGAVAQPGGRGQDVESAKILGIDPGMPYLNTGVLLMDLCRMRSENAAEKILAVGRSHARLLTEGMFWFTEQDALNAAFHDRWLRLHPKWNSLASTYLSDRLDRGGGDDFELVEAAASPAIVHFEGTVFAKPWNYRCAHPMRHLYRAYRERTPWPLERLDDSGPMYRLLSPLPPASLIWLVKLRQRVRTLLARSGKSR